MTETHWTDLFQSPLFDGHWRDMQLGNRNDLDLLGVRRTLTVTGIACYGLQELAGATAIPPPSTLFK